MAMKRALIRRECKRNENIGLAVLRLMHRIDFSFFRKKKKQINSIQKAMWCDGGKTYIPHFKWQACSLIYSPTANLMCTLMKMWMKEEKTFNSILFILTRRWRRGGQRKRAGKKVIIKNVILQRIGTTIARHLHIRKKKRRMPLSLAQLLSKRAFRVYNSAQTHTHTPLRCIQEYCDESENRINNSFYVFNQFRTLTVRCHLQTTPTMSTICMNNININLNKADFDLTECIRKRRGRRDAKRGNLRKSKNGINRVRVSPCVCVCASVCIILYMQWAL